MLPGMSSKDMHAGRLVQYALASSRVYPLWLPSSFLPLQARPAYAVYSSAGGGDGEGIEGGGCGGGGIEGGGGGDTNVFLIYRVWPLWVVMLDASHEVENCQVPPGMSSKDMHVGKLVQYALASSRVYPLWLPSSFLSRQARSLKVVYSKVGADGGVATGYTLTVAPLEMVRWPPGDTKICCAQMRSQPMVRRAVRARNIASQQGA